MADAADTKYPISDVIDELVRLRSEFLAIDALPDNDGWSKRRKAVRKEGILYQFKQLLHDYLPTTYGIKIEFNRNQYRWMPYYTLRFDSSTLASNSTTLTTIRNVWMDNIVDFLTLCRRGASGTQVEKQDEEYQVMKDEVEALIERFKTLIVSDEFL